MGMLVTYLVLVLALVIVALVIEDNGQPPMP